MPAADRPRLPILISRAAGSGQPARHEHTIRTPSNPTSSCVQLSRDLGGAAAGAGRRGAQGHDAGGRGWRRRHDSPRRQRHRRRADHPGAAPMGSGNDFCRSLGLAPGLATALAAIVSGTTRSIDVLQVNGARVVTVAGLGVVARSALQVGRLARPGSSRGRSCVLGFVRLPRCRRRTAAVRATAGAARDDSLEGHARGGMATRRRAAISVCSWRAARRSARASDCRSTWSPTTADSRSCWWRRIRGCPWRSICRGSAAARVRRTTS